MGLLRTRVSCPPSGRPSEPASARPLSPAQPSDPNHSSSSSQHKPACSVSPRPLSRSTRQDPHLSRPLQTPKSSPGPLLCLSPLAPSAPRLAPLQPPPSPPGPPGRRRQPPTARPDDHQGGHAGRLHRSTHLGRPPGRANLPFTPSAALRRLDVNPSPHASHYGKRVYPFLPTALLSSSSSHPDTRPSTMAEWSTAAVQVSQATEQVRAAARERRVRCHRPR